MPLGVRVFQLAKELGMSSKELMTFLHTQGHKVNNHMCALEDTVVQILRERLPRKSPGADTKAEAGATKGAQPAGRSERREAVPAGASCYAPSRRT